MFLYVLCLCMVTSADAALWRKENIQEMQRIKYCFNEERSQHISKLFHVDSADQERREAIAMDVLARLVKSGTPFCQAYQLMLEGVTRQVEKHVRDSSNEEHARWQETLSHVHQHTAETRITCSTLQSEDTGPLSAVSHCLSKVLQKTVKALIVAQYADEENAVL